jgi:ribosomal protein S18 acetylase RimI-like enzyme
MSDPSLRFRSVTIDDLKTVIEIENEGFTPEEAATPEAFEIRIKAIPDTFLIAEDIETNRIVGFIDGPVVGKRYITDDLFDTVVPNPKTGGHQSVLGVAVRTDERKRGIGSALVKELIRVSLEAERDTITLTCRDILIDFYTNIGFKNEGVSESTHGGYVWYNMIYELKTE